MHTIDFVEHRLNAGTLVVVRPGQVQQWHDRLGAHATLLLVSDVVLPPPLLGGTSDSDLLALDDGPTTSRPASGRWLAVLDDMKRLSADIERFDGGERDATIVRHALLASVLRLARDLVGSDAPGDHETRIFRLFRRELEASFLDRRSVQHYNRSFEQQRYRASGLNLLTGAIVHWNTVYLERAVEHLPRQGESIDEARARCDRPDTETVSTVRGNAPDPTPVALNRMRPPLA